jgi:hypothetical protein
VSESSPTSLETLDFQQIMKDNDLALDAPLPASGNQIKFFCPCEQVPLKRNPGSPINNILTIFAEYGREWNSDGTTARRN